VSAATRKVVFPWWIENDRLCSFENSKFGIQNPKIEIMITMMITRCHPIVNDKRPPIATTFIDKLFKIGRGRGLVRRSSANDHF
jgi:hypothetical protein